MSGSDRWPDLTPLRGAIAVSPKGVPTRSPQPSPDGFCLVNHSSTICQIAIVDWRLPRQASFEKNGRVPDLADFAFDRAALGGTELPARRGIHAAGRLRGFWRSVHSACCCAAARP